jgi:hypothetical protein
MVTPGTTTTTNSERQLEHPSDHPQRRTTMTPANKQPHQHLTTQPRTSATTMGWYMVHHNNAPMAVPLWAPSPTHHPRSGCVGECTNEWWMCCAHFLFCPCYALPSFLVSVLVSAREWRCVCLLFGVWVSWLSVCVGERRRKGGPRT